MKKIFLLMVILLALPFSVGWGSGVVNNSTSSQTAHDSLSIPFFALDSAGNYVALASGDSVFLHVSYPGGALAFEDSGAYNDGDITTATRHGRTWYNWKAQVSNLDGTPTEGVYSYQFSVHDETSADLWTDHLGDFQLYATSDFDVTLDGIAANQTDLNTIITDVTGINGWSPILDNDSLIIDQSSLEDMTVATATDVTNGVTLANDAITAAKIAADAIGASEIADDAIDYATFAATAPTAWWNQGKTGYALTTQDWNVGKTGYTLTTQNWNVGKTGYALTTADWNVGKTGYSLSQSFPTNFADMAITVTTGRITVGTNNDKTGYALSTAGIDGFWEYDTASVTGATAFGFMIKKWNDSIDALISSAGGTANITGAQMAAIADSVANNDSTQIDASPLGVWMKNNLAGDRYFGDTTFAYILNAPDYLSIPNDTASCTKDTSVGVHPSVVFIADSIGVPAGDSLSEAPQYTFVMGYTPFGGGNACGVYKENPCIVGSNNGDDWEIPYYIDTSGGGNDTVITSTPLVDTSYHHCWHMSDPKLLYDSDTVYCFYRVNWGSTGVGDSTAIFVRKSVDLIVWTDSATVMIVHEGRVRLMSPVVIKESDGSFSLIYLDDSTNAGTDPQMVKINAPTPDSWDTVTTVDTLIYAASEPGRVPWHIDIKRYGTFYHAFVTERITGGADYSNHFAVSANGTTYIAKYEPILKVGDPGQWDDNILYKMCGIPNLNNIEPFYDVFYSAQSATGDGEYHIGRSRLRFSPRPDANIYAISGDMKAANDLENLLDGGRHVTLYGDIDGYVLPGRFNNLLTNGDFETDSVDNNTAPDGWTFTDSAAYQTWIWCKSVNDNFAIDTWRYFIKNHIADTLRLTQRLYLDRGIYILSGYLKVDTALNKMGLAISNQDSLPTAGFTDSIFVSGEDIFKRYTLQFTVSDADSYSVGVVFQTPDSYQTGWVDDVKLQRVRYDSDPFGSSGKSYTLYVCDSTDGDSLYVGGVTVSAYSLGGSLDASMNTDTDGKITFSTGLDTIDVIINKPNYYTSTGSDTIAVAITDYTDTIYVFRAGVSFTSPPSGSFCNIYVTYYRDSLPVKGAQLIVRNDNLATDSTNGNLIGPYFKKTYTDSTGTATALVYKSKVYHDSTLAGYDISFKYGGRVRGTWEDLWVPDSASYKIRLDE